MNLRLLHSNLKSQPLETTKLHSAFEASVRTTRPLAEHTLCPQQMQAFGDGMWGMARTGTLEEACWTPLSGAEGACIPFDCTIFVHLIRIILQRLVEAMRAVHV